MKAAKVKKGKSKGVGDLPMPKGSVQMASVPPKGKLPGASKAPVEAWRQKVDPKEFERLRAASTKSMQQAAAKGPLYQRPVKPNVKPAQGRYKRGEEAYKIMGGK